MWQWRAAASTAPPSTVKQPARAIPAPVIGATHVTSQSKGKPLATLRLLTTKSSRLCKAVSTRTLQSRKSLSTLRLGTAPPASTSTCRQALTSSRCLVWSLAVRVHVSLWYPSGSNAARHPSHLAPSCGTGSPRRKRKAVSSSAFLKCSEREVGQTVSHTAALRPPHDLSLAGPGAPLSSPRPRKSLSKRECSCCSSEVAAQNCQPCCHSPGSVSSLSDCRGRAPPATE